MTTRYHLILHAFLLMLVDVTSCYSRPRANIVSFAVSTYASLQHASKLAATSLPTSIPLPSARNSRPHGRHGCVRIPEVRKWFLSLVFTRSFHIARYRALTANLTIRVSSCFPDGIRYVSWCQYWFKLKNSCTRVRYQTCTNSQFATFLHVLHFEMMWDSTD